MPKVSVIIPTYNRAKYVKEAIDSVLAQTFQDFEIIVVDDGSIDGTGELLKNYNGKIRYIYQTNKGLPAARNTGIRAAKGEYIAFLDSDDIWLPDKLDIQLKILEKNGDVGLIYSRMFVIDEDGVVNPTVYPKWKLATTLDEMLTEGYGIGLPSTAIMRKECFDRLGFFDESLIGCGDDGDMFYRVEAFYKIIVVEKPLIKYRKHNSNMTYDRSKAYENYIRILNKLRRVNKEGSLIFKIKYKTSLYHYNLGKIYFNEGVYQKALKNFIKAVANNPLMGKLFFSQSGNKNIIRIIKIMKPYLSIVVSCVAPILSKRIIKRIIFLRKRSGNVILPHFKRVEQFEKYLEVGRRVLDVGTGTGVLAKLAFEKGTEEVFAVDINPVAVEEAQRNVPRAKVILSDLFEKVEGVFDTIIFAAPWSEGEILKPLDYALYDCGITERFFREVKNYLAKNGSIWVQYSDEFPSQYLDFLELIEKSSFVIEKSWNYVCRGGHVRKKVRVFLYKIICKNDNG